LIAIDLESIVRRKDKISVKWDAPERVKVYGNTEDLEYAKRGDSENGVPGFSKSKYLFINSERTPLEEITWNEGDIILGGPYGTGRVETLPSDTMRLGPSEVYARMTTNFHIDETDLEYISKVEGPDGNCIFIEYKNSYREVEATTCSVTGSGEIDDPYIICVELRRQCATEGGILATASEVKAAIESESAADALVEVNYLPGESGTGTVYEFRPTSLWWSDLADTRQAIAAYVSTDTELVGYDLYYTEEGEAETYLCRVNKLEHTFTNLKPGVNYNIRVEPVLESYPQGGES